MNSSVLYIICIVGCINIICFIVGAKVGLCVSQGKEIKIPDVNPVKAITEHKKNIEQSQEIEKFNVMLENIDNYDGTGLGQIDIRK